MFSNRMRMTGFSGIDVADMVNQMMRAEAVRLDRLRQTRDLNVWRQDMLRNVRTDTIRFSNNWFSNITPPNRDIRRAENFTAFTANVINTTAGGAPTNTSGVNITAGSNATAGRYRLEVLQVAQADLFRSAVSHNGNGVTTGSVDFLRNAFGLDSRHITEWAAAQAALTSATAAQATAQTAHDDAIAPRDSAWAALDAWMSVNGTHDITDQDYIDRRDAFTNAATATDLTDAINELSAWMLANGGDGPGGATFDDLRADFVRDNNALASASTALTNANNALTTATQRHSDASANYIALGSDPILATNGLSFRLTVNGVTRVINFTAEEMRAIANSLPSTAGSGHASNTHTAGNTSLLQDILDINRLIHNRALDVNNAQQSLASANGVLNTWQAAWQTANPGVTPNPANDSPTLHQNVADIEALFAAWEALPENTGQGLAIADSPYAARHAAAQAELAAWQTANPGLDAATQSPSLYAWRDTAQTALEDAQTALTEANGYLDYIFGHVLGGLVNGGIPADTDSITGDPSPAVAQGLNARLAAAFGTNADGTTARVTASYVAGAGIRFVASVGNSVDILNGQNTTGFAGVRLVDMGLTTNASQDRVRASLNPVTTTLNEFMGRNSDTNISFIINDVQFNFSHLVDTSTNPPTEQPVTLQHIMNTVNNTPGIGVRMSFNELTGRFTLEATNTGNSGHIRLQTTANADGTGGLLQNNDVPPVTADVDFLSFVFAGNLPGPNITELLHDRRQANPAHQTHQLFNEIYQMSSQDAEIILNRDGAPTGDVISRESNVFLDLEGGIDIRLTHGAAGQIFEFDLSSNPDTVRDFITDFVNGYNEFLRSILDLAEVRRPRQEGGRGFFLPLTQDERRAMSEREIEVWEEQARRGILHRDHTLRQMQDDLTSALFMNVRLDDGTHFNLMNMGIRLSREITDFGMLEIDHEAFNAALENDMDAIRQLFTNLATPLSEFPAQGTLINPNDDPNNPNAPRHGSPRWARIASGGLGDRLADILGEWGWHANINSGTLPMRAGAENTWREGENDFSRLITEQNERISNMLTWLQRREDSLFRQFSRMEMAMMQAQSQMMFFDQMFWAGQQ